MMDEKTLHNFLSESPSPEEVSRAVSEAEKALEEHTKREKAWHDSCQFLLERRTLSDFITRTPELPADERGLEFGLPAPVKEHINQLVRVEVSKGTFSESAGFLEDAFYRFTALGYSKAEQLALLDEVILPEDSDDADRRLFFNGYFENISNFRKFFDALIFGEVFTREELRTEAVNGIIQRILSDEGYMTIDLIQTFGLSGPEVAREARGHVRSLIRSGNLTPAKLESLATVPEDYGWQDDGAADSSNDNRELSEKYRLLDEAWRRVQERYGIQEDYRELILEELKRIVGRSDVEEIESRSQVVIGGDWNLFRKLVSQDEELHKELLQLIERHFPATDTPPGVFTSTRLLERFLEQDMVPIETLRSLFKRADDTGKLWLQKKAKVVLDQDAALAVELLGDHASVLSYQFIREIRQDKRIVPVPNAVDDGEALRSAQSTVPRLLAELRNEQTNESIDYLAQADITQSGEAGLRELREMLQRCKGDILEEGFDPSILERNSVVRDFAKGYLRIDEREWGTRSLFESVQLYLNQEIEVVPLDRAVYQPSEPLRINTVRAKAEQDFAFSEQFRVAFGTLTQDIAQARELAQRMKEGNEPKPFSLLVGHLSEEMTKVIGRLEQSQAQLPEEKRGFVEKRLEKLRGIDLRSLDSLEENLQVLLQTQETHSLARQLLFTFAYAKHGLEGLYEPPQPGEAPSVDSISGAIGFVNHIGYEETWKRYFKDKRSRNAFQKIASTRPLEEELTRMQNQGTAGTTVMQFIPTRGFLMEVSGSLADACWQDTESDLIAIGHPNFASVTFVQNPKTKDERIAGACLLIETETKDGQPLLVIRGLNPLENVINRLQVEDFYRKFIEYCKGIAERSGRTLAIVIDNHSGGSATNRPVLFNYLQQLSLRKIPLASRNDTFFNGYDIDNDTFLVE